MSSEPCARRPSFRVGRRFGLLLAALALAGGVSGALFVALSGDERPAATDPPAEPPAATAGPPLAFVGRLPGVVEPVPPEPVPVPVVVTNPTDAEVLFGPPTCSCACTTPERPADRLAAGESMMVQLGVRLAGRRGPVTVECRWADQHGRPWVARGAVTVYPRAAFDRPVVRPGGAAEFDQHWAAGAAAPAPPAFSAAGLGVTVESADETPAEPAVARRRTRVRLAAGDPTAADPVLREAGSGVAVLLARTPPAGVAIPNRVDFVFAAGDDAEQVRRVMVRDGRGLPLAVTHAVSDVPGVAVEPGDVLTVRAKPGPAAAGRVRVEAGPAVVWVTVTVGRSL